MAGAPVRFVWKKTCDTCRAVKKQLDAWGVDYDGREMNAEPMDAAFVAELMGDRPVKPFLNTRNAQYRALGLSKDVPDTPRAVALIAETNNLLRRPLLYVGDQLVIGRDLKAAAELLGQEVPT
jgi:regulatory protein spx